MILTPDFDEATHTYTVKGTVVSSVTQILKERGYIQGAHYTEDSRRRGKAIHLATELYDKNNLDYIHPSIKGYLESYKLFRSDYAFTPTHIELLMYHPTLGYAGTADRIGMVNGNLAILEIKTGLSRARWHLLQTAAYYTLALLSGIYVTTRYGLYLQENGKYKIREHKQREDMDYFMAAAETTLGLKYYGGTYK